MGRSWLRSSVAFVACLGAGRGFPLIVHQHTKITLFRLFGAIASPDCLQISVLRGFLGGFFGFIGRRCVFGCLVAFVGLVGLYACRVKRLRSEKRIAAHFLGLLRSSSFLYCCFACLGCFAPVVCAGCVGWFLCCWWFSFPSDGMTKRKGKPLGLVLSSFVGCVLFYPIALGITKLLQAVSILRELPTIQATEKKLQLYLIIL